MWAVSNLVCLYATINFYCVLVIELWGVLGLMVTYWPHIHGGFHLCLRPRHCFKYNIWCNLILETESRSHCDSVPKALSCFYLLCPSFAPLNLLSGSAFVFYLVSITFIVSLSLLNLSEFVLIIFKLLGFEKLC